MNGNQGTQTYVLLMLVVNGQWVLSQINFFRRALFKMGLGRDYALSRLTNKIGSKPNVNGGRRIKLIGFTTLSKRLWPSPTSRVLTIVKRHTQRRGGSKVS